MSPVIITLLFLVFAIVMFILEKIPLGLTATIVAIGLNITGVLSASDTFAGYVNSNVILCVGMFVVGQALFETGMANKIGGIVTCFAKSEHILITAIMVIVGVMSGFLSNTGTAAVLIPVVCGIADESGYSRGKLLMPLVFAAALGGNLSIIGAPGNLMGIDALNNLGIQTSFFEYIAVGAPMLVIGILYFVFIGYKFLPDTKGEGSSGSQSDYSSVPKWKQITSLIVLIVVILAMIFEDQIDIKLQVSACIGAAFLVLTGVISEKAALQSIDLKVVLLFGGSLALAKALETTGAGSLIADTIVGALGENPNPIILLLVIFIVGCTLTNFMSNTATTALMVPIAVSLAQSLGADPRSMVIATVISCSCSCAYATPIGMPANTMVVGLGGYKFNDYVKSGLPLIGVSFVICMVLLPILYPFY